VTSDGLTVSSTKIREFLLEGNVAAAAILLGRPYLVPGVVGRGAGRGRGIGFATANVDPGPEGQGAMLPAPGVYAVGAALTRPDGSGKPRVFDGVCNVGVKPTVSTGGPVTAEVHLLDYGGGDLYGEPIEVTFLERLRDEQRFPGIDALKLQIGRDVERARALFAVKRGGPG
jgi:riboflavin kinase/FMN adenylyltransferase